MRRVLLVTALTALMGLGLGAAQSAARKDADRLEKKLHLVLERGAKTLPTSAKPLRTPVTDREVNAYLQWQGKAYLPVGVVDPEVTILDAGRVQVRATVDLDAVRKSKERPWTDLLSYVSGLIEIRAAGKLKAANGQGTFELESATFGGVPIPKALLQEVVSHYSRTLESPQGFDFDQPFALPHQIRQVELQRGAAVIVQ